MQRRELRAPKAAGTEDHARYTLMALTEALGSERQAVEFMRSLAGTVIVLPSRAVLEKVLVDRGIVASLDRDPGQRNVGRLAELHSLDRRYASKLYRRLTGVGLDERRERGEPMTCSWARLPRVRRRLIRPR